MLDLIAKELNARHTVEIGGRQCLVTVQELIIKQVMRKAVTGDRKSLWTALQLIDQVEQSEAARRSESLRAIKHEISLEQLRKMSIEERTALYFQTIRESGREPHLTEEEMLRGHSHRRGEDMDR